MSKKFFTAIKQGDLCTVKTMIERKPELVNALAKTPPRSDDGQSALQIAIRNQRFEIAHYLLDLGADVDHMEPESCCNAWRMPVVQDAIVQAVMLTRWNTVDPDGNIAVFNTQQDADNAYCLLKRMLDMGADIGRRDSYGNGCLMRSVLSARQILPKFNFSTKEWGRDRSITAELRQDLQRVFRLLLDAGAMENDPYSGLPLAQAYREEPVGLFLNAEGCDGQG